MTAESVSDLVQSMPQEVEAIEASRHLILGDSDAYRAFENSFYEAVPGDPADAAEQLRAGISRYLLGQESRALETLGDIDEVPAHYVRGRVMGHQGRYEEALAELAQVGPAANALAVLCARAECLIQLERREELDQVFQQIEKSHGDASAVPFARGLLHEMDGDYDLANQQYQQALAIDPNDAHALFRLAYGESLRGETEAAIELYERVCNLRPTPVGALINLGLLFEDEEDYQLAASRFQQVLDFDPNNSRARMYFQDAISSTHMFYDEEKERKEDKRAQVLRIPVTDFELSVRSRNCLANMNVRTLGDLIRLSENELLAFKNFGETSLHEIKQILTQKGLRLGMLPREEAITATRIPAPTGDRDSVLTRPVTDLDLSVRSRKALDTLNVRTIGDLVDTAEPRLLACKNFGQTSLVEIKKKLSDLGLALKNP